MKTRIISAVFGLLILVGVFLYYNTILFNICVALVAMLGVIEFLYATKYSTNLYVLIVSALFSLIIPFSNFPLIQHRLYIFVFLLFLLYLIALFLYHQTMPFETIAISMIATLFISFSFSTLVFLRDLYPSSALYYITLIFLYAWITDAGAYFTGRVLGKHPLAKNISPKKTIEGAIGGILFCIIFSFAHIYLYTAIMDSLGYMVKSNIMLLLIISLLGSLIGIFGDLFASIIKRQTKIKDFGNIMPGHGGVLDRFDSVLLIAPFILIIAQIFPMVTIV